MLLCATLTRLKQVVNSTDTEFGEISNVISGSSTSFRYTNQLSLNGNMGANIKGRVLHIMGNLPFELATLATISFKTAEPENAKTRKYRIKILVKKIQNLKNKY